MISKTMREALNKQVTLELQASHSYLALAGYFETLDFTGMASWMESQSLEERGHAMKIYAYLNSQSAQVTLGSINSPTSTWDSVVAAFEFSLEHEKKVTASIHSLVQLAQQENDYATLEFLQWFVKEQVEEEDSIQTIISKLKLADKDNAALLLIDTELLGRKE